MSRSVVILGIGADGLPSLSPRAQAALASATFLAGGRRHLQLAGPPPVELFTITNNLPDLVQRLRRRSAEEQCVVLASGDPLFYGIGHVLGEALGCDQIVVEPSLSSLQLAFARVGVSWHDAAFTSIHGRPLADSLLPVLGKPKVALFTQDGSSPSAVAAFFIERGLHDYEAIVGESLGTEQERVSRCSLPELIGRVFGPLNFMILLRHCVAVSGWELADRPAACIPDARFAQPEKPPILLTHADIRAIVVGRFRDLPPGPLWDIGAGLGASRWGSPGRSRREIVAAERSAEQADYLRTNRLQFLAYNMRIVVGSAPVCLEGEADPAGVFLGGSGGQLDAILDTVVGRILPSGILVANFVSLENLSACRTRLQLARWPHDVTHVQISQGRDLAGLTVLSPDHPVWIVQARRP